MSSSMLYKFSDLAEEEKWWIAFDTLGFYIEEIFYNPEWGDTYSGYKTNKVYNRLIYILNDLGVFNRTIRHVDWNNTPRVVTATVKILRKLIALYQKKYNKNIEIEYKKCKRCSIDLLEID